MCMSNREVVQMLLHCACRIATLFSFLNCETIHLSRRIICRYYFQQYEDFCQQLIQFLNLLELHLEGKSENLWQLGGLTPWLLLPRFLQTFVQSSHTPVQFDEFFLYTPKNSMKENKMKNMAKLWLAHDTKKVHKIF